MSQPQRGLLRPVRADQSEQTGLFVRGGLKETGATSMNLNRCIIWTFNVNVMLFTALLSSLLQLFVSISIM